MKTLLFGLIIVLTGISCCAQKYETWVLQSYYGAQIKGDIVSVDDYGISITSLSKISIFIPEKDSKIKWDDMYELKIRNKTRHQVGTLIGLGVGFASGMILAKNWPDKPGSFGMGRIFASTGMIGLGALVGSLVTSAKITIPLQGKSAIERKLYVEQILYPPK
jgi:hypothetical protein